MLKKPVSYVLLIVWIVVSITTKYLFLFMKEVLEASWKNRRTVLPWILSAILGWLTFSLLVCVLG